jgi:hypothetical protein
MAAPRIPPGLDALLDESKHFSNLRFKFLDGLTYRRPLSKRYFDGSIVNGQRKVRQDRPPKSAPLAAGPVVMWAGRRAVQGLGGGRSPSPARHLHRPQVLAARLRLGAGPAGS